MDDSIARSRRVGGLRARAAPNAARLLRRYDATLVKSPREENEGD